MLSIRATLAFLLSAAMAATPSFGARVHHAPTAGHSSRGAHKAGPKTHKTHGQQSIDPERATEIQQALIREHYLSGEASGRWDAATEAAMQKYQADQGWQTKLMPDSRALKKLGLGPDYSGAINAKAAGFADGAPTATFSADQTAGFAAAAGVNR